MPNVLLTRKANKRISSREKDKSTEKREKISQSRRAIEEYLAAKNSNTDPVTGQEFFKPVTGRPPKEVIFIQRDTSRNISEQLYSLRSKSQDTRRLPVQSSKLSIEQSEKIVKRIKELRYKQIFEELKPDVYERVTAITIKKSTLSPRTLEILSPLLKEIQEFNEKLSFAEFQESLEILMKVLRPDQKSIILKTCKSRTPVKSYDFRPKINQSRLERPKSVENLYERGIKQQKWVQQKLENQKKMREASEMNECTFKPRILKSVIRQNKSLDSSAFEPFLPLSGSFYY